MCEWGDPCHFDGHQLSGKCGAESLHCVAVNQLPHFCRRHAHPYAGSTRHRNGNL